jgi:hypothetical protein
MTRTLGAAMLLALLCTPHTLPAAPSVSKVNGSVRVSAGETVGDVSSVNGSIRIEENVRAEDVETVNGSVEIGEKSSVGAIETVNGRVTLRAGAEAASIESVNGALTLEENAKVRGELSAVNGALRLARNAHAAGGASNVNGGIELEGARVDGGITTTNGDIDIGAGSRVTGGLLVKKPSMNWLGRNRGSRIPRVTIGPDAVVEGTLRFEREVELHVSDRAKIGRIEGVEPARRTTERSRERSPADAQVER